nr:immunoglobulin light chain junction region [Macaca mulatta]
DYFCAIWHSSVLF